MERRQCFARIARDKELLGERQRGGSSIQKLQSLKRGDGLTGHH